MTLDPLPQNETQLMERARNLGLHGTVADWTRFGKQSWLPELLQIEESERGRRSLERRLHNARIGQFKSMVDYDWSWPRKINRLAIEEAVSGGFLRDKINIILIGPNGVSKTMIAKNIAYNAAINGHTVLFVNASDMLADLAAQETPSALSRRLQRYCRPDLLCIDEVGYLSYNTRYADLLFQVVSRRYESCRPILLTTNKTFEQWADVFPTASCVVTLVDRLVHRCEQIVIEADSYRAKEARDRAAAKAKERAAQRRKS